MYCTCQHASGTVARWRILLPNTAFPPLYQSTDHYYTAYHHLSSKYKFPTSGERSLIALKSSCITLVVSWLLMHHATGYPTH